MEFTNDEFSFLPTLKAIVDTLMDPEGNRSTVGPAVFELETKYQNALKFLDSCPAQDITLEEQKQKVEKLISTLEQRRNSFITYQSKIERILIKRQAPWHADQRADGDSQGLEAVPETDVLMEENE